MRRESLWRKAASKSTATDQAGIVFTSDNGSNNAASNTATTDQAVNQDTAFTFATDGSNKVQFSVRAEQLENLRSAFERLPGGGLRALRDIHPGEFTHLDVTLAQAEKAKKVIDRVLELRIEYFDYLKWRRQRQSVLKWNRSDHVNQCEAMGLFKKTSEQ
ncbi:hypothetical protein PRIPAC_84411, partial [Pristionchus pacificus]|uniref:Uncharacterized protein n=1 Tax=Pristionchus pacificus TaxID=54126 RepID=A0A2A6BKV5_PRIPA